MRRSAFQTSRVEMPQQSVGLEQCWQDTGDNRDPVDDQGSRSLVQTPNDVPKSPKNRYEFAVQEAVSPCLAGQHTNCDSGSFSNSSKLSKCVKRCAHLSILRPPPDDVEPGNATQSRAQNCCLQAATAKVFQCELQANPSGELTDEQTAGCSTLSSCRCVL